VENRNDISEGKWEIVLWDLPDDPMDVKRYCSEFRGVLNHVDGTSWCPIGQGGDGGGEVREGVQ
jgi:hypothetical protein